MQANAFQLDAFQQDGEPTESGSTAAIFYLPFRAVSGAYSTGVTQASPDTGLRSFLPHSSVKVLKADGTMNPVWYKFFQVFVDVFLAGAGTYSLEDILAAVEEAQDNTTQLSLLTAAVQAQTQTNAEALEAARQVIVDNSLTGSDQIPPVALNTEIP